MTLSILYEVDGGTLPCKKDELRVCPFQGGGRKLHNSDCRSLIFSIVQNKGWLFKL